MDGAYLRLVDGLHRHQNPHLRRDGQHVYDAAKADPHLSNANPFDYLTELQKHPAELASNPSAWMPWNYAETLARVGVR